MMNKIIFLSNFNITNKFSKYDEQIEMYTYNRWKLASHEQA